MNSLKEILHFIIRISTNLMIVGLPSFIPNSIMWETPYVDNTLTSTGNIIGVIFLFVLFWCVDETIGKKMANIIVE